MLSEDKNNEKRQLQGKCRSYHLSMVLQEHNREITCLMNRDDYSNIKKKAILNRITDKSLSFKKKRVDKKLANIICHINDKPLPNVYTR